eukprot:scaffold1074_cov124-Skeletonema_dohrnii-CCMP3373.AAC.3
MSLVAVRGQGGTPIYYSLPIIIMAEEWDGDEVVFVYTGGDQVVPVDVVRVRIDKTVTIIPSRAFQGRNRLICVEFHDGIERIEKWAFNCCFSLKSIKLLGVKIIKEHAFRYCPGLAEVEFGVKLETIEERAFFDCTSLSNVIMPSLKHIGEWAFDNCQQLTDLELPEGLETLQEYAFCGCNSLRRIAMPLRDDMIGDHAFYNSLETVDLVGGIHRTIASLHMESWKNQMKDEVNIINLILPNALSEEKTTVTQQWIRSVIRLLDHYKARHKALLKEATTLLELALWKANLDDNEEGVLDKEGVRTTRGRRKRARKEICITSGASIVIKNVLPFLTLLE